MTALEQWPRVSVCILSFNRRDIVRQTLQKTLHELDYPREQLEVILVDNESSDGTSDMVREEFPDVKLIVLPKNRGVAAWNEGFRVGTGDYFLVLDDDCFLSGADLQKAVRGAQQEGADLVSFLVRNGFDRDYIFNREFNTGILEFWGCSVLISRRAIERVGGFDSNIRFLAHELEFSLRFFDAGLKHLHLPEVVSVHMKPPPADPKASYVALIKGQRRNWGYIAAKLLQPRDALPVLLNMVCRVLVMSGNKPVMLSALPELFAGFREGLSHHAPVRREVSAIYRRHFVEFVNGFRFVPPRSKRRQFFKRRPKFYPLKKASLQL